MTKMKSNSTSVRNLIDLLRNRAEAEPSARAYLWLMNGESEGAELSRAALEARARTLGIELKCLTPKSKSALLMFPPGLQFIEALFGCWYAGIIAIPAYVPHFNHDLARIEGMLKDSGCTLALTLREISSNVQKAISAIHPKMKVLAIEDLEERETKYGIDMNPKCREIAYLQYTSGSTASPKGVIVTHSNVLENLKSIESQGGFSETSLSVNWLPHFHDMGLIYGILQPLFTGFPSVSFAPSAFTHKPLRWLSAITRYRGTHCGGPNFAYDLCVERVTREECDSLDLSGWQVAFNGAEPIRSETLKRFARYFSAAGFRSQAFYPVYGLAEATLKVTSGVPGAGPNYCAVDNVEIGKHKVRLVDSESKPASTIVGCGRWHAPHEVVIVNPETKEVCPTDEVGEVWVSGPSITAGYWRNKAATQQTFGLFLASGQGPFLRTGDLGFVYRDELFITGRLKDCIIVRGRNHYPQDIEESVEESHPALRRNGSAAFCLERDGRERVVVVCQVKRQFKGNFDEIIDGIRKAIAENHEIQAFAIVLVKTGGLPKTSSGKIQRQLSKALFQEDKLSILRQSILDDSSEGKTEGAPIQRDDLLAMDTGSRRVALRTYVRHAVARVLRRSLDHISGNSTLASLGLDSLMLADLKHAMERELAISISTERLFGADVDGIAEDLLSQIESATYSKEGNSPLERIRDRKHIPASYPQEQLWLIQQLFPETSAYNLATALCLRGEVDARVLKRSLDAIWARHEGLRSVFVVVEGEPRVELLPAETGLPLPEHDLRGVTDAEAKLKEWMIVEAQAPFDLQRGPLIRAHLVRMAEQEYVLLLTQHHIVSDGWSMGILARELGTLYGAFRRGEENPLEPLGIQYPDYAAWQREWLSGERLQKQSEYWREALADAPALLELPTDRPRPEQQSFAGGYVPIGIDRDLTRKLRELSRRHGATLYMTLLGAWAAVLSRLSGQAEVVIGTPVANRRRAETEGLIGFFVNTLALRIDLRGEPSVAEMLKRVRGMVLGAQEHQDVPFEQVVEMVQPPRHLNHTPIFQVMFAWQSNIGSLPELPGVRVEMLGMPYEAVKFDLQLDLTEEGGRIVGGLNYATALFEQETIERQRGYLLRMLETMAADSEQEVTGIDILGADECRLLLESWNATHAAHREDVCIHRLFEEQVERTPEAIAVVYRDQALTYAELNRQANQLAHYLIGLGVKPDDRVGICVQRGMGMVAGLLGILKSGGAYVALDPGYPSQRLRETLEDAGPRMVLSDAAGREAIGGDALKDVTIIDVSELGNLSELGWKEAQPPVWADQPRHNPEAETLGLTSHHLAYLIYTSGSSGKPKGVTIEHRNAGNLLCWARKNFAAEETQHTLFCTSLQFDLSIYECFVPLISGGTVYVVEDALALIHQLQPVSLVNTVPSAMASVLEHQALPCTTRTVNLAGEPLKAGLIRRLLEQSQVARVCNLYGPTETTTYSTWISMERGGEILESIGRPIANTKIYLLDGKQRPVPLGAVGEIYIGGAGVARGYLNRPELTAERFLRDPFTRAAEARMYRTGDIGRYRRDGNIEFLGRNDHQVKIRGFRIELGEIETRLAEHERVREAVVVAREDEGGEKRLVAYVVAGEETDAGELAGMLRAHLAGILPEYMVPAAFVAMKKLPLTPNGKLDRKGLPGPEGEAYAHGIYEPPQGEIEEQLAGMWQELLGVERVGRQDRFFDIGGHSLLAMRLVARVQQVLGVELPVTTLFARPQLAQLAEAVKEAGAEGKQETLAPLLPISRLQPMPSSFAQQRLWFLAQMEGGSVTYHLPAALRLQGELDREALKRSLDAIWARHEGLRSVFVVVEGELRVELLPAETGLPLPEHDLRGAVDAEEQLQKLMFEEANAVFDLAQEPLIRAHLVRMEEDEHVLLLTQHHIVSDGWSIGILVREMTELYEAYVERREPQLGELKIQYGDYAVWQRKWLRQVTMKKQLMYWREQLAGAEVLELPTDRVRPEAMSQRGDLVRFEIAEELTEALRGISRREGVTMFMTLLAGFQFLLGLWTGQEDIVVGTDVANRSRPETQGLIGFFVNQLVLRTDLRGGPNFREVLRRVRKMTLGAYANQDVPFEKLVQDIGANRDVSRNPFFEVKFVLHNEMEAMMLPGLTITSLSDSGVARLAKLDMTLFMEERQGSLSGTLEYRTSKFARGRMVDFVEQYQLLLRQVSDAMDTEIHSLTAVSLAEPSILASFQQAPK